MDRFIQKIAKAAGAAVLKKFGKVGVKYMKSEALWDCVTEADLISDRLMVSAIKKKYPDHGIISEESGSHNPDADYVWIIDPIDGTFNFSIGVPQFGVMVCLAYRGDIVLSAIDLPATKEFFFAKNRKGSVPKREENPLLIHETTAQLFRRGLFKYTSAHLEISPEACSSVES